MKAAQISSPVLCQLPLMTPSRPTAEENVLQIEWRPARTLIRMMTKVYDAIGSRVPVGYEDETGFHYGVAEIPETSEHG
jgi:hypothetical protein